VCGKNNGCIRTQKTYATSNYTTQHFLQHQKFADTVALRSTFTTAAVAGCQTNLATSFHSFGGFDIVSPAEIALHTANVVYEPMTVMGLVLSRIVTSLCDLRLTRPLGSLLRALDARM